MSSTKSEVVCDTCAPESSLDKTLSSDASVATEVSLDDKPEDPLDPLTFRPPPAALSPFTPGIVIEFCDRCRWLHRATWVQTELFLTFPSPALKSIAIIPHNTPETGGRFRVWLSLPGTEMPILIWDRKTQGGFPELKDLKQRIRDHIQPGASLGHSDKPVAHAKKEAVVG